MRSDGSTGDGKPSVDIALVSACLGEAVQPGFRRGGTLAAPSHRNVHKSGPDVLGHALGVAADIEVRALFHPGPEFGRVLAHAGLDIDLLGLIARESEIESRQQVATVPVDDLILVEKLRRALLIAEEQPVLPLCPARVAFFEASTERRAGPRREIVGAVEPRQQNLASVTQSRLHDLGAGGIVVDQHYGQGLGDGG